MDALTIEAFARWWRETGEHELRQVLLWRWDPIGVADWFPSAADEYDSYAPHLVQVLRSGGDTDAVMTYLRNVELDAMGLSGTPPEHLREVARVIEEWYGNSQEFWSEFGPVRR
jgi:hypothetical protein